MDCAPVPAKVLIALARAVLNVSGGDNSGVEVLSRYLPRIVQIEDDELKRKTASVYLELFKSSRWKNLSEQPIFGNLAVSALEHTNAVVELCLQMAEVIERNHKIKVNKDHLVASAILHDASKLVEFDPSGKGMKQTRLGELGQHTIKCVSLMLAVGMPLEVVHAVLAHTPKSGAVPKTVEALLVYFAEAVDYNVLKLTRGLGTDIAPK